MKREKIKLDKWWLGRERRRSKESNIEKLRERRERERGKEKDGER